MSRLCSLFLCSVLLCAASAARSATLDDVTVQALSGDRVRIELTLSEPVDEPLAFAIDNPARVALDFPGVTLNLASRNTNIGVGIARSVTAVEAGGRTRVVLNLLKLVPYELKRSGKQILVTLEGAGSSSSTFTGGAAPAAASASNAAIENVDFRRGENGEGRVLVTLSDPSIAVDTKEEGNRVTLNFLGANIPDRLLRRLDVLDFATPVSRIETVRRGRNVQVTVRTTGRYEMIAYQSDDLFTLDIKPLTPAEEEELKRARPQFTGERLSLNFQDIQVRAVLQLIADFTGLNLVASDTVGGSLTLRLKNVPWDQALDIILKTKGLAMRQTDNVILVAPSDEIAAREKLELESQKQIQELAPLRSEFVQVNYAKAAELANLLKSEGNSLLTERGNVTVDLRTNTLLVRDTQEAIDSIRRLVSTLDVPVRQVLIESRIVVADEGFSRDIGVRFGVSRVISRGQNATNTFIGGGQPGNTNFNGNVAYNTAGNENYIVDLPIGGPSAAFNFAIVDIPNFLLQLELQALQLEGRGEVLANPRVVTSNQQEAVIEQGTEIPFQEASSSGATSTSFKKAVLMLRVKPQITPDDRVLLDLNVSQDAVGAEFGGIPSINTRAVQTQVLVNNGDTVVLGGIYEQTKRNDVEKVPFFGDLPYFGFLFRTQSLRDDRTELLIFVTPKILKEFVSSTQ